MDIKDVQGFEDSYTVSTCGVVISKDRVVSNRIVKAKIMSLVSNGTGYLQVTLNKSSKRRKFYIHRLVWVTFNGEIPEEYEIDHIDCDKTNNKLNNLQLMTRSENMAKCLKLNPHIEANLKNSKVPKAE